MGIALAALACAPALVVSAADSVPPGVPPEVTARKSVFDEKLKTGKDPFFPNSTRRMERAPVASTNEVVKPVQPTASQLSLKGIVGKPPRRLALINDQTFEVGEEQAVKTAGGKLRIKVLEITDRSAKVQIEGDTQPHELILPANL